MILLKLFLVFGFGGKYSSAGNISATGGGVVMRGGDLVLRYEVDHRWDRCFWYWYEDHDR